VDVHEPAVEALCSHHGEADPKQLILRLCRELLNEAPTDAGPSPIVVLGSCRGIRSVSYAPLADASACSGILVAEGGGYRVTLDEREPPGRQRRSHAHEITHTFFREVSAGPAGPEEEQLCEAGAAELTMPAARMRQFVDGRGAITFSLANECAHEFDVTNDAAARRLVELSEEPVCYLVASKMRTTKQAMYGIGRPRLRIASWTWSPSWIDQRPYRGLVIEPNSVIERAFLSQDVQVGRGPVGISHRDGTCDIEAVGYTFTPRGRVRSQVAILLNASNTRGR